MNKPITLVQSDAGSVTITPIGGDRYRVEHAGEHGSYSTEMGGYGLAALSQLDDKDVVGLFALAASDESNAGFDELPDDRVELNRIGRQLDDWNAERRHEQSVRIADLADQLVAREKAAGRDMDYAEAVIRVQPTPARTFRGARPVPDGQLRAWSAKEGRWLGTLRRWSG